VRLAAGLYNGMVAPLVPYGIRGAIWYQGEANVDRAYQYRALFQDLIRDWRRAWGQGNFPFLFVQLPNCGGVEPEPAESTWAELREAQTMALRLPNTGMAVAIDIGEADNIHPRNKQDVGHRLALAGLAVAYGQEAVFSGPIYDSVAIEGKTARVRFRHVGGGLAAAGGEPLKGFAIAGEDRRFVWAEARIEGEVVLVWSDQVPKPAAVRYGWADNPVCNLQNKEGLPASPFRTDDWPALTVGKR
jgi:sialate O-acetylesterase